jgi:hypothetical protein
MMAGANQPIAWKMAMRSSLNLGIYAPYEVIPIISFSFIIENLFFTTEARRTRRDKYFSLPEIAINFYDPIGHPVLAREPTAKK